MSRKLKIKCFETFLNEDPSFFDQKENDIGDLMSRLIDDPLEIERVNSYRVLLNVGIKGKGVWGSMREHEGYITVKG